MPEPCRLRHFLRFAAVLALLSGCGGQEQICALDRDCAGPQACRVGRCVRVPPARSLGSVCWGEEDCAQPLTCKTSSYGMPDGMCTQDCSASDGDCPSGSRCIDLRASLARTALCAPDCGGDADCRFGYVCCASEGNACLPAGLCPPKQPPASPDLGAACRTGSCAPGELCIQGDAMPGGACTRPCVLEDDSTCPPGGRCVSTDLGLLCLPGCSTNGECRPGFVCGRGETQGACVPAGPAPRTCDPSSQPLLVEGEVAGPSLPPPGCRKPLGRSALPRSQVEELGLHRSGEVVQFTTPLGAAAIGIACQGPDAADFLSYAGRQIANTVVPTALRAPDGRFFYEAAAAAPSARASQSLGFFASASPGTSLFTLPSTTASLAAAQGGFPSGSWSFMVNDAAAECARTPGCSPGGEPARYWVSALVKPGPPQATGTLDVAFYLVGVDGLDRKSAPRNPSLRRMVQTFAQLLSGAGICLGTVAFHDVPAWARSAYAMGLDADRTEPCGTLGQMFTLSRGENALPVFLVQQISTGRHEGQILGLDGTIPGPSTIGGTVHSGAAVAAADLFSGDCGPKIDPGRCGADRVAYIAAHEAGHWLGLYHTTEADQSRGVRDDPLDDTPGCACTTCAATPERRAACTAAVNPSLVTAAECNRSSTCGGGDNLMFWLLDPGVSRGALSPQQSHIMRANPLVQ